MVAIVAGQRERCTTDCGDKWLRSGVVRVKGGIKARPTRLQLEAARTTTITRCNKNGLALCRGLLEVFVLLLSFLLAHVFLTIAPTDTDDRCTVADNTCELVVVALGRVGRLVDNQLRQLGSHAQNEFHVQLDLNGSCPWLAVETIQYNVLYRNVAAAEALGVCLNIA